MTFLTFFPASCQRKSVELHVALSRDLIVELTHRSTAKVSRVFVLRIGVSDSLVDFFKVRVRDDRFTANYQLILLRDLQRDIIEHPRIAGNDFARDTVTPGDGFRKFTVLIRQHDRQTVQLPGQQSFFIAQPAFQCSYFFRLVQRKHRRRVLLLGQTAYDFIPHMNRRTVGQYNAGFRFQPLQFIV